jgi:nucleoid-associated protein YgaU
MTRETKIGLLVGLAFIIVIGILLSDHMTSTSEPPLASLQQAGNNLRSGLGQPTSDNPAPVVVTPNNVTPGQTVLTRDELNPRPRAATVAQAPQPPITVIGQDTRSTGNSLVDSAKRAGEELVDGNGNSLSGDNTATQTPTAPQATKVAAAGTYKAEPGDSVTKIAAKVYGTSTKALRDGIINANASLKENPNRIVVGHTYTIPPVNGSATPANATAVLPTPAATPAQQQKTTAEPEHVYVVQSGDTLWSIARDEVGNAGAVAAIKELNADVLKGSDRVRPNMKLRLPAKPVASAN